MQVMRTLFLLAALVVGIGAIGVGALMAIMPVRFDRWRNSQVRKWSDPNLGKDGESRLNLEARFAGIIISIIGCAFSWVCVMALLTGSAALPPFPSEPRHREPYVAWHSFAIGIATLVVGFAILTRRDPLLRWAYRRWYPNRTLKEDAMPELRVHARRMGIMLIIIAVWVLIMGVRSLER